MAQGAGAPPPGGLGSLVLPMIFVDGIWWVLVISPQRRFEKARRERLASLTKGMRIVTSGGLHGTIFSVSDDVVVVEIAERARVTLNKESVATVVTEEES